MPDDPNFVLGKLHEQVTGDLPGDPRIQQHAGLIPDPIHRDVVSWLESNWSATEFDSWAAPARFEDTRPGQLLDRRNATAVVTDALTSENPNREILNYMSGLTDQDLTGGALGTVSKLLRWLHNGGQTTMWGSFGLNNTGKTNFSAGSLVLLWRSLGELLGELEERNRKSTVVTNIRTLELADDVVMNADEQFDWFVDLEENERALWVLDEASTWCNERQFGHQIAQQMTPLLKRLAKFGDGVDLIIIGHTGIDCAADIRRHMTTVSLKTSKKRAEIYGGLEDDRFVEPRCVIDDLEAVEQTLGREDIYDPDDSSLWDWNLDPNRVRQLDKELGLA